MVRKRGSISIELDYGDFRWVGGMYTDIRKQATDLVAETYNRQRTDIANGRRGAKDLKEASP